MVHEIARVKYACATCKEGVVTAPLARAGDRQRPAGAGVPRAGDHGTLRAPSALPPAGGQVPRRWGRAVTRRAVQLDAPLRGAARADRRRAQARGAGLAGGAHGRHAGGAGPLERGRGAAGAGVGVPEPRGPALVRLHRQPQARRPGATAAGLQALPAGGCLRRLRPPVRTHRCDRGRVLGARAAEVRRRRGDRCRVGEAGDRPHSRVIRDRGGGSAAR